MKLPNYPKSRLTAVFIPIINSYASHTHLTPPLTTFFAPPSPANHFQHSHPAKVEPRSRPHTLRQSLSYLPKLHQTSSFTLSLSLSHTYAHAYTHTFSPPSPLSSYPIQTNCCIAASMGRFIDLRFICTFNFLISLTTRSNLEGGSAENGALCRFGG